MRLGVNDVVSWMSEFISDYVVLSTGSLRSADLQPLSGQLIGRRATKSPDTNAKVFVVSLI